jgi:hypothetical protein
MLVFTRTSGRLRHSMTRILDVGKVHSDVQPAHDRSALAGAADAVGFCPIASNETKAGFRADNAREFYHSKAKRNGKRFSDHTVPMA